MQPNAYLFDMDGILYHGSKPLPYAIEFVTAIQSIPHAFITNNPTLLPEQIIAKLVTMGFPKPHKAQIITAGIATADYLATLKPNFRYFAIGANGLHQALQEKGIEDQQHADFVVVGEGEGLDFNSLTIGINLILQQNAQLISTNPDTSVDAICNGKPCVLAGGGALVAPLQLATGITPITIGKPFPLLYEMALKQLDMEAEQCLMIGDRPDTDIVGALNLGMQTALVRTGRFKQGDMLDKTICPDFDENNLLLLGEKLGFN